MWTLGPNFRAGYMFWLVWHITVTTGHKHRTPKETRNHFIMRIESEGVTSQLASEFDCCEACRGDKQWCSPSHGCLEEASASQTLGVSFKNCAKRRGRVSNLAPKGEVDPFPPRLSLSRQSTNSTPVKHADYKVPSNGTHRAYPDWIMMTTSPTLSQTEGNVPTRQPTGQPTVQPTRILDKSNDDQADDDDEKDDNEKSTSAKSKDSNNMRFVVAAVCVILIAVVAIGFLVWKRQQSGEAGVPGGVSPAHPAAAHALPGAPQRAALPAPAPSSGLFGLGL